MNILKQFYYSELDFAQLVNNIYEKYCRSFVRQRFLVLKATLNHIC